MRHSRRASILAAIAAAAPCVAHANAGVGFLMPAAFVLVLALVPVVVVEGAILSWRLRLGFGRGQWVSLVANVFSTIAGGVLGIAFDFALASLSGSSGGAGLGGFLVSLFFMFWVSWWLETFSVKRRVADSPAGTVRRATLLANVVTYLLLGVALYFSPLEVEPGLDRSRMTEAVNRMGVEKLAVEERFLADGRFPPPRVVEATGPNLRRLEIEATGRIAAQIASPRAELHGKRIFLEPLVREGKVVEWRCYAPDAPFKHLPPTCRYRTAAEARNRVEVSDESRAGAA